MDFNSEDPHRGYYYRTLNSECEALNLVVPQNRNGNFIQYTILYRKRRSDG